MRVSKNHRLSFSDKIVQQRWIYKYEKHQRNFNCVVDCDTTRAEVTTHRITAKYALLLFVQTFATLLLNSLYERKVCIALFTNDNHIACRRDSIERINFLRFYISAMIRRLLRYRWITIRDQFCTICSAALDSCF